MKRPKFTLRQLEYFIAVAEAGTISEAAIRLHVSQPGLSQALSDLERVLDVQLTVRRKAHGVTLTATGAQVLRHARDLMSRAEDLESIAAGGDVLSGSLQLGCYVTLAPTALPPLLQGFTDLHPGVDITFVEDTQDLLQQRLLRREIDLAILYDMELEPEMTHAVIDSVRPHILLPAKHPLAREPHVSLADLAGEPQVLLDAPPSSHNTLAIFHRFDLAPDVRYRPRTFELTRALVGRGLGYALLVQRPANDRTYEGTRVVIKEIAEDVDDARVVIAWPKAVQLNRRAAAFVEFSAQGPGRASS
jgi:DNA-binding transcriptional LysR family regulator